MCFFCNNKYECFTNHLSKNILLIHTMKKWFILLSIVLLASNSAFPQIRKKKIPPPEDEFITQPKRIEFSMNTDDWENYEIFSCEENGIILFQKANTRNEKGFLWKILLLDTDLNTAWIKEYILPFGFFIRGYDYEKEHLYILFQEKEFKQNEFFVIDLQLFDGNIQVFAIDVLIKLSLTQFEVTENTTLFGGTFEHKPVVIIHNLNEKKTTILPGFYENRSNILSIHTDNLSKLFTVFVSEEKYQTNTVTMKVFSLDGNLVYEVPLKPSLDKGLINGTSIGVVDDELYIAGVFGKNFSEYSQGIYVAKINKDEQQDIYYTYYSELKNFFSYMKPKHQKRMQKKAEKKKLKSSHLHIANKILLHNTIRKNNEHILIGEVYYPIYNRNNNLYNPFSFNNYFPYQNQYRYSNYTYYPVKYEYTYVVIISFNNAGEILWDNSFAVDNVSSYTLEKNIATVTSENSITMLYIHQGEIRSRIIQSQDIQTEKRNSIKLKYPDDELEYRATHIAHLEKWYENNVYLYGVQYVKNKKEQQIPLQRKIFYINKIVCK